MALGDRLGYSDQHVPPLAAVPSDIHVVSGGSSDHRHWFGLCLATRARDINTDPSCSRTVDPWQQARTSPPGFLTSACSSPLWTISSSIFLHTVRAPRLCFLFHISTRTPSFLSLHHTSSIGVAPEVGGCVGGVYHSLSIHPLVDMSVGCFRFLSLKNKAAVEHG